MGRKRKLSDAGLSSCGDHDLEEEDDNTEDNPVMRNSANARERQRMRVLSKAFVRLKTTLPWVPPDTKLSKLDTLRLASCYIAHLKQILDEDNSSETAVQTGGGSGQSDRTSSKLGTPTVHPMSLTWPFSFNGRPVPHPSQNRVADGQGPLNKQRVTSDGR